MTEPTDRDAEQALRDMLSGRIGALTPPTRMYEQVRHRHLRRRTALVGGTAAVAAAAAVAVPTVVLRDRPDRAPTAAGAPTAGTSTAPDPRRTGTTPCTEWDAPAKAVPGLRTQSGVLGSLGGDPEAVTAVLRTGWAALAAERGPGAPFDPATARVRMVQRADDGWIVGAVGATDRKGGYGRDLIVLGPDTGHLTIGRDSGAYSGAGRAGLPDGAIIEQVGLCGPARLVVVAPPGSTGQVSWITAVAPDLTITAPSEDMPLRPDGVAVFDRPADDHTITLRVTKDGRTVAGTWFQYHTGPGPAGLPAGAIEKAIAAAPGNGDKAQALAILRQQYTQIPVDQSDVQVLWAGTSASGWTVAAAATTLPGGAHYVWGGAIDRADRSQGIRYFEGLVAADEFDRTALVHRFPGPGGPLAVLFSGTREVQLVHGDAAEVREGVAGGTIDERGGVTRIRVLDENRRELRVVETRQLPRLPSPMN